MKNVIFYCIERHFKKLFTVIIAGGLTNSSWHLYRKCFVVSLDIGAFYIYCACAETSTGPRDNVSTNSGHDSNKILEFVYYYIISQTLLQYRAGRLLHFRLF